jgi:hypothetical protein
MYQNAELARNRARVTNSKHPIKIPTGNLFDGATMS